MANSKKTTVGENFNGGKTKFEAPDLATIRANFDGLQKQANSLPDGKQKKNIMNAIENTYFATVSWFRGAGESFQSV